MRRIVKYTVIGAALLISFLAVLIISIADKQSGILATIAAFAVWGYIFVMLICLPKENKTNKPNQSNTVESTIQTVRPNSTRPIPIHKLESAVENSPLLSKSLNYNTA
jgi:hypothetical protein